MQELATRFESDYNLPEEGEVPINVAERNHWYYQGKLLEIGNDRDYTTYVPAQDKNRSYGNQKLGEICHMTRLPNFGYQRFISRARSVDVI